MDTAMLADAIGVGIWTGAVLTGSVAAYMWRKAERRFAWLVGLAAGVAAFLALAVAAMLVLYAVEAAA